VLTLAAMRLQVSAFWACAVGAQVGSVEIGADAAENRERILALAAQVNSSPQRHQQWPALQAQLEALVQAAETNKAAAWGTADCLYQYFWFGETGSKVDSKRMLQAVQLYTEALDAAQCPAATDAETFRKRGCEDLYTRLLETALFAGREAAQQYQIPEAAKLLAAADTQFKAAMRTPGFSGLPWVSSHDFNHNDLVFPGATMGPVLIDPSLETNRLSVEAVPIAKFLEENAGTFQAELQALVDSGKIDTLQPPVWDEGSLTTRGQEGGSGYADVRVGRLFTGWAAEQWNMNVCQLTPQTCQLLQSRAEVSGCGHASAEFVRVHPGGKLKPTVAKRSTLTASVGLEAGDGSVLRVGQAKAYWAEQKVTLVDATYMNSVEWEHEGVNPRAYLAVTFCHPCEDQQKGGYSKDSGIPCLTGGPADWKRQPTATRPEQPAPPAAPTAIQAPFAAAARWAATLPDLKLCDAPHGGSEQCPGDSQHGGPNPLSALNTWKYAVNALRLAMKHASKPMPSSGEIAPVLDQMSDAMDNFMNMPRLDIFNGITQTGRQIFDALDSWLVSEPAATVKLPATSLPRKPVPSGTLGTAKVTLTGGVEMPVIGFGTWKIVEQSCYDSVRWALEEGYRHIDTAEAYQNEAEIGRAIRDSGIPREQLFVATKAASTPLGMAEPGMTQQIFAQQLQQLQLEYVDVYMVHSPGEGGARLQQVWQQMEALVDMGRVRALGVSNANVEDMEFIWNFARIRPVYLQVIFKAYKPGEQLMTDKNLLQWCRDHNIQVVGYSIINSWPHMLPPMEDPCVVPIAKRVGRTPSQVLHRWALQHGVAVIPKSERRQRIAENSKLLDFHLTEEDMATIDGLATLSESTRSLKKPIWYPDVFGIGGGSPASAPPARYDKVGAGECNKDADVPADIFTLGGGGHLHQRCMDACSRQETCSFVTYFEASGYCHMYRTCEQLQEPHDGAVVFRKM